MRIENHRLVDATAPIDLRWLPDDHGNKPLAKPLGIIIHCAVTTSLLETYRALKSRDYVEAHGTVDGFAGSGPSVIQVAQHVPFDRMARHAGKSEWDGLKGLNACTIGLEIANPGPLVMGPGGLKTTYGKAWPKDQAVEMRHRHPGTPKTWTHWATYTPEEVWVVAMLCKVLVFTYPSIYFVAGHDEVSPGRKFDPGPAFDMDALRRAVFEEAA